MHHFGFARVAAGTLPRHMCGDPAILQAHKQCMDQAMALRAEVLVFPAMSLFGSWEESDLYQDDKLLGAVQSLSALLSWTVDSDMVVVAGLPLICRNMVYQTAAIMQRGKLLAVIPGNAAGNAPGDITVLQQTVPFSADILIRAKNYTMGVVPGGSLFSKAMSLTQQGATLLVHMDERPYTVGGFDRKKAELAVLSANTHTGILYANFGSGVGGRVYGGERYLYEDGRLLCESRQTGRLLIGEMDSQAMKKRQRTTGIGCMPCIEVTAETSAWQLDKLSRPLGQTPYLDASAQTLEEILQIQADMLCARLHETAAATVSVMASGGVNTALVMLSCGRAVQQDPSVKERIRIVVSDDMRQLKGAPVPDLTALAEKLGLTVNNCAADKSILVRTDDLSDIALGAPVGRGIYCNASLPKMAIYKLLEATDSELPKGLLRLSIAEAGHIAYDYFLYYRLRYGFEQEKVLLLARQAFAGVFDTQQIDTLYQYFDKRCIPTGQILAQMGQDLLGIVCE